jgi:hypothetical protein
MNWSKQTEEYLLEVQSWRRIHPWLKLPLGKQVWNLRGFSCWNYRDSNNYTVKPDFYITTNRCVAFVGDTNNILDLCLMKLSLEISKEFNLGDSFWYHWSYSIKFFNLRFSTSKRTGFWEHSDGFIIGIHRNGELQ